MRHYTVSNSKGSFIKSDMDSKSKDDKPAADSKDAAKDTTKVEVPKRQQVKPFKKTKTQEVKNTK